MLQRRRIQLSVGSASAVTVIATGIFLSTVVTTSAAVRPQHEPEATPVVLDDVGDAETAALTQAAAAPNAASKLHYTDAAGEQRTSVLVYMEPTLPNRAAERTEVRALAARAGGKVQHEYDVVMPNVLNLRDIPESQIEALRRTPGVQKVEIDEYHADVVRLHDSIPLIRGLDSQITGAGFSADGAGVRVCVVDTGIDSDHVMYSDRIDASAGYDFYNNDSNPEDDNGHGSHVSGIVLGGLGLSWDPCGTGSIPIQGVAPAATLIGAKVLNSGGGGFDSDIIAGINHCADQSPSGGRADVINMSIGTGNFSGICTHSWAVAANNAVANGVVAVAASGNENNSNSMGSPACGVDVIAVGMTWKNDYPTCEDPTTNWPWGICTDIAPQTDEVGCFSNESDFLDVSAPGANIWSASNAAGGSSIVGQSGTSMSSPTVAGLAALVLDLDASLTPAEVRQIIRDGAIDMGPAGFDRAYGYGRIDVLNTLALVTPCMINGDCDDSLFCNGAETCSAGSCLAGNDPCPGEDCDEVGDVCVPLVCNDDGTCDAGEDCNNCSNDCFSGSGAACGNGVCEAGDGEDCVSCAADCNGRTGGRPSNRFCCGDGDGQNPLPCSDSACSTGGWVCTDLPAAGSCCGDGTCEGSEDGNNCAIDCACQTDTECDDGVACTDDACVGGFCQNTANNANCPDDGQFCNGSEFCDAGSGCSSTGDPCGSGENCNEAADTCDPCTPKNGSCSSGGECCSGVCKGNGRCR